MEASHSQIQAEIGLLTALHGRDSGFDGLNHRKASRRYRVNEALLNAAGVGSDIHDGLAARLAGETLTKVLGVGFSCIAFATNDESVLKVHKWSIIQPDSPDIDTYAQFVREQQEIHEQFMPHSQLDQSVICGAAPFRNVREGKVLQIRQTRVHDPINFLDHDIPKTIEKYTLQDQVLAFVEGAHKMREETCVVPDLFRNDNLLIGRVAGRITLANVDPVGLDPFFVPVQDYRYQNTLRKLELLHQAAS